MKPGESGRLSYLTLFKSVGTPILSSSPVRDGWEVEVSPALLLYGSFST